MSFENVTQVAVRLSLEGEPVTVGQLALKSRQIFFEYAPDFVERGLELSPFKLPLKLGAQHNEELLFEGLPGLFNDSLPDGWGRLLLDRQLAHRGIAPSALSPLDRLCMTGDAGMGALSYAPAIAGKAVTLTPDLDEVADEIAAVQADEGEAFVEDLLVLNGSSAGARPKIMMVRDETHWLIKFRSMLDPKDIGPIEYAYHLMAHAAGLDVPDAALFPAKKGPGYFGVKRFDRVQNTRVHMHTVSGLLHCDHRLPSMDYETVMKVTAWLTKDIHECEKQYRAAVFNVLSHNRDDHAKNFSFLMDEAGTWRVSPAYDLTFSSGPAGEHCTMVMGEGRRPTADHLLQLATVSQIASARARKIIDEVKAATAAWGQHAKEAGVTETSSKLIAKTLKAVAV